MELELVTVGTELLLGFTLDSNAAAVGRILASEGVSVARCTTVADNFSDIKDAVARALQRSHFVIATGGLGPTSDDITKYAVADVYGVPVDMSEQYLDSLRRRFAERHRGPMPESNRRQAEIPRGAQMLANPRGTAPGLWLEGELGITVLLPGIPDEMRGILRGEVIPRIRRLQSMGSPLVTQSLVLRTTGVAESKLADTIATVEPSLEPVSLAYLPGLDGTDLRLTAWRMRPEAAAEALDRAAKALQAVLGQNLYGEGDVELAQVVLEHLRDVGCRLAVAESCTGGLIGAKLTEIPGASEVFAGGIICYGYESKVRDLGVPEFLLAGHGAVSTAVTEAMAGGVCERFGTEAGVAVSGIAGPTGGTTAKPVGTVCCSVRFRDRCRSVQCRILGERAEVRYRSAQMALDMLRRLIEDS